MYLFVDGENGLEMKKSKVTSKDNIAINLRRNQGFAAIISKDDLNFSTAYDNYTFFEAEEYPADKCYKALDRYASNNLVFEVSGVGLERGLQIPFTAEKAGKYELTLYAGGKAMMVIDVNGENADSYAVNCNDKVIREYTSTVELKRGENVINIYVEKSDLLYLINLDRVSLVMVEESGNNWLLIIAIASSVAVLAVAVIVFIKRKKSTTITVNTEEIE